MITDFARAPFCALLPLGLNAASVGLGSELPFAALCTEVCGADKAPFRCGSYQGLVY
jgi:hypothetical protein